MSNLITTNIRIPKDDYLLYQQIAAQKGESFAELVRKALAKQIKTPIIKTKKKKRSIWDLPKYAVTMNVSDASTNHDKYIYSVGLLEKRKK